MNIIVFSKDRPALLDLFLRSFAKYYLNNDSSIVSIIQKITEDEFKQGYDKIKTNWYDTTIVNESNLKEDVLNSINESDPFIVFFTDDDIFYNHWNTDNENFKEFAERDDILCHSLRLNKNLTYCYPSSLEITKQPDFTPYNVFRWRGQQGYYNYPMSVNGHVFKTADILPLLKTLEYDSPTWLEYQLSINPINKFFMNCCDKSIIVNNPCNVVQDICKNRNENIDNKTINDRFLNGERLSLQMVKDIEVSSCHQPIDLIWE